LIDFFTSDEIIEPQKGDLLISEPYLPDPNFERTVILICEHDENGTVGFVLNKEAQVGLGDVMNDLDGLDMNLFVGGPVQQDTLHFLHRSQKLRDDSNDVTEDVFWGGDYDKVTSMMNTRELGNSEIKFFVGYSGWSEGQLMTEMKQKSWIVFRNPSLDFIFEKPAKELWKHVLREKGGKFRLISNYPTDPRLN